MIIRAGGLMRCCIQSLTSAPENPSEGDTFRCLYCSDTYGMVFRNGAWQWAHGDAL